MAEQCGAVYEGNSPGRRGATCVRPQGHDSYHGTELDMWLAEGGFYWHEDKSRDMTNAQDAGFRYEMPEEIYLQLAENGNIRKWDRKPFEGGHRYVRVVQV